jgi:hypothetical protein
VKIKPPNFLGNESAAKKLFMKKFVSENLKKEGRVVTKLLPSLKLRGLSPNEPTL